MKRTIDEIMTCMKELAKTDAMFARAMKELYDMNEEEKVENLTNLLFVMNQDFFRALPVEVALSLIFKTTPDDIHVMYV